MTTLEYKSNKMRDLIVMSAQFLCQEGRYGSWGTTRTSGTAIWALCECGLGETQNNFIAYCLRQLLDSDDCIRKEKRISFNDEVWDTSIALIALQKGAPGAYADEKKAIVRWLLSEAQEDNLKNEPWETLWALQALMEFGEEIENLLPFIKRCITWIFEQRNSQGILISHHYMGLLLSVLNLITCRTNSIDDDQKAYMEVSRVCEDYLKREFLTYKERGMLWSNEPWIVGHALLGIANAPNSDTLFFRDLSFNNFLENWYETLEWLPAQGGWVDLVDTSFTLVGLSNYYRERERSLGGGNPVIGAETKRQLASGINFRFEERTTSKLIVHPIWRTRKFTSVKNLCFVLMPFRSKWSERIYRILRDILRGSGLIVKRGDEIFRADIMEDIWCALNECRVVVAECTGRNPNVFYELGIAHTLGKDVIILTQEKKDIPFDIQRFRYIQYEDNDDGYRKLKELLPEYINAFLKGG
jgi:hypothetical protein